MFKVGKLKLVITDTFNGCIVVTADSFATLKEGYLEAALSHLAGIKNPALLLAPKPGSTAYEVVQAILASDGMDTLEATEDYTIYGNQFFQICCFNVTFGLINRDYPEFFKESSIKSLTKKLGNLSKDGVFELIFNEFNRIKDGRKIIANPLSRISLYEFAANHRIQMSDDMSVVKVKGRLYAKSSDSQLMPIA